MYEFTDDFLDILCNDEVGFWIAYTLGIARPGIDFIDVGEEC